MVEAVISGLGALLATALVTGTAFASYLIACRLQPGASPPSRWAATGIVGMALATLGFHTLIALHAFTPTYAQVGVLAVVLLAIGWRGCRLPGARSALKRDLRWLRAAAVGRRARWWRWLSLPLLALVIVTGARASLLPPLGWDELTYHAVKAGLWVQEGGQFSLAAPGGWGVARHYFGGSELFLAWAMIPFGGDMLLGLVDYVQWAYLALVVYAFGAELGLYAWQRLAAALYVAFVPTVFLAVGSGYSELSLNGALLAGSLFGLRFSKRRDGGSLLLALTAFGLAGGIKITGLMTFAVALPLLAVLALMRGSGKRPLGWLVAGTVIAAACIVPWLAGNLLETGYPLAYTPVQVLGLKLGVTNSAVEWYMSRQRSAPSLVQELRALSDVFQASTSAGTHLGMPTLLPLALVGLALARVGRQRWQAAVLPAAVCLVTVASYLQPGFAVVRIHWSLVVGRFLLPVVCLAVPLGFLAFRRHLRLPYGMVLFSGVALHSVCLAASGWSRSEAPYLGLATAAVAMAVGLAWLAHRRLGGKVMGVVVCGFVLWAVLSAPVLAWGRAALRYGVIGKSVVFHRIPHWWRRSAALVDHPGSPSLIAVTGGAEPDADKWFLYYFLGSRLQNRLVYVPVSRDGSLVEFWPPEELQRQSNYDAWLLRLEAQGVDYVVSFDPGSLEMGWMEGHRERFKRLDGDGATHGLYALNHLHQNGF